jgi:MYXO-CTERM domain-containing protein
MRSTARFGLSSLVALAGLSLPAVAAAATLTVGPGQEYAEILDVTDVVAPGDVVEVMGDAVYAGDIIFFSDVSGTEASPITLRGVAVNGKRPHIQGGDHGIVLNASHFVFEGFEVTGSSNICVVHKADDVTIRDVLVHDCYGHGILGTDSESGDLTMEHVEVHSCGEGTQHHQVYIATDESMYPGSRFRMQHSYVHDGLGGNNVKSRAERNEIYHNWIEAPAYHVLDLIGPDGQDPSLAREHSDVVGNVLIQNGTWTIARMGGDGTGSTSGRYRFAFNTIVLGEGVSYAFRATDEIESLELSSNVVYVREGGQAALLHDDEANWISGRTVVGSNNWLHSILGASPDLTGTVVGSDPGFVDLATFNLVPAEGSALVDASGTSSPPGLEVPGLLAAPQFLPPARAISPSLEATPRGAGGAALDVGAYELGNVVEPGPGGVGGQGAGASGSGASGSGASGSGASGSGASGSGASGQGAANAASGSGSQGSGCQVGPAEAGAAGPVAGLALLALASLALRRRRA